VKIGFKFQSLGKIWNI